MASGRKPRVFDLNPGKTAASAPKVVTKPSARSFAIVEPEPEREYLLLPEPYELGQRVEVARGSFGQVFAANPCTCKGELSRGYVYVIELDKMLWGSWFYIGHSPEVDPI